MQRDFKLSVSRNEIKSIKRHTLKKLYAKLSHNNIINFSILRKETKRTAEKMFWAKTLEKYRLTDMSLRLIDKIFVIASALFLVIKITIQIQMHF